MQAPPHERNRSPTSTSARLGVFQYVTVEKAELYRAVMRVFVETKERFGLYLRPREVHAELGELALPEVEHALQQLSDWGNLEMHHDTSAVSTIEEFHRPRWLYQMSVEGEAAEQAIAVYQDALRRPGELQTVALSDIRSLLGELLALASAPEPDAAKIHLGLRTLRDRFEELTSRAQAFIGSLQRAIELRDAKLESFIAYKRSHRRPRPTPAIPTPGRRGRARRCGGCATSDRSSTRPRERASRPRSRRPASSTRGSPPPVSCSPRMSSTRASSRPHARPRRPR